MLPRVLRGMVAVYVSGCRSRLFLVVSTEAGHDVGQGSQVDACRQECAMTWFDNAKAISSIPCSRLEGSRLSET